MLRARGGSWVRVFDVGGITLRHPPLRSPPNNIDLVTYLQIINKSW